MKTTATTEIMGGLGNQLFQIFNLLAYCFRHNSYFYFSTEPIIHGQRKITYWKTPFLEALKHFVNEPRHLQHQQPATYHEHNFHYEAIPQAPPSTQLIKFFGYFQSYKYFQDQQDIIYKFIRLRETQAAIREKTKEKYDYENTVALHFRVGDYKKLPNHHPLMTIEYYTAALLQLVGVGETPPISESHNILYFCEEADQAYVQQEMIIPLQQNPLFKNKFTYQCIDHKHADWEQLIIMSLCRHHIIANSTFSWWGAYLGLGGQPPTTPVTETGGQPPTTPVETTGDCIRLTEIQGGAWACGSGGQSPQVYYPKTWFGPAIGHKNISDLFPLHWHRINI